MKNILRFLAILAVAALLLSPAGQARAAGNPTVLQHLYDPVGVATDTAGNIFVTYANLNGFSSATGLLAKLTPAGSLINYVPLGTGEEIGHLALDPATGQLWDIGQDGTLFVIDPNTLQFSTLGNVTQLPVDLTHIYDIASKTTGNLGGLIQPAYSTYGDIALLRHPNNSLDVFLTGISQAQALPFVMRLRFPATQATPAFNTAQAMVLASSSATQLQDISLPRGIAVNNAGTVLTTLPVLPPGDPFGTLQPTYPDDAVAFSSDFPENPTAQAPHIVVGDGTQDLESTGMTADAAGNFYVATGRNGTPLCGAASGGLLMLPANFDLNNAQCFSPDQSAFLLFTSQDIAVAPANDGSGNVHAYVTVNPGAALYPILTSDPGDLLQWSVQPPAAAPQVTTNTNPAPFAAQPVGQNSAALPVTLANNGAGPLQVTQATLGGANPNDFAIAANTCTGQVAPGSSCTVEVAFKPTAGGPRSATLSIADNAPDSPQSVTLSGTGIDTQQTAVAAQQTAAAQQAAAQQTAAAQQVAAAQQAAAQQTAAAQAAAQQTAAAAAQQTTTAQQIAAQQTSAAQAGHSAAVPPATTPTASPAPASTSTALPAPTSTRGAGGTTRPSPTGHRHAPTLALIVQLLDKSVATGGSLRLHLRTAAHARIGVTLQVLTTRLVVTGKGKHRKRVQRTVVLYNLTGHGTTDKHGVLNGRIRVSYKPQRPVQAVLTVTAAAAHSVARRTLHLTIRPPSHRH